MKTTFTFLYYALFFLFISCAQSDSNESFQSEALQSYTAPIIELSDEKYPDNPDISIRHPQDGKFSHSQINILPTTVANRFDVEILPNNEYSDTIRMRDVDILEWIPTIPDYIKSDEYLSLIGIVNQEWNREQVQFASGEFEMTGETLEKQLLSRIDLARNCLNAGLWEIIAFAKDGESEKPVYHGWFNFPEALYAKLFMERNGVTYDTYKAVLENWKDPESKKVELYVLRSVDSEMEPKFQAHNDKMYPVTGDRKKKFFNILYPVNPKSMNDFLTDSTKFATFVPPGCYSKASPRSTELRRFAEIEKIVMRHTTSNNVQRTKGVEFELFFKKSPSHEKTSMVVGGLILDKLPVLAEADANNGWHMPMGIANHPFGQSYASLVSNSPKQSAYFAMLLDAQGRWLDSHFLGIDGVVMHQDDKDESKLHLWLLSFERHALVGHYTIYVDK